jgi:hypothetical protein
MSHQGRYCHRLCPPRVPIYVRGLVPGEPIPGKARMMIRIAVAQTYKITRRPVVVVPIADPQ